MTLGQITLVVYALLMLLGGGIGFLNAKSKPSLIAGSISAILLGVAWFVSRSQETTGYLFGLIVAVLLLVVFGMRLKKTGKFMPSGMLLIFSVVAGTILAYSYFISTAAG